MKYTKSAGGVIINPDSKVGRARRSNQPAYPSEGQGVLPKRKEQGGCLYKYKIVRTV